MTVGLDALKQLLLNEWDPIGVRGAAGAEDEYDSYAGDVAEMLADGAGAEAIARFLGIVETDHIGLALRPDRNLAVARRAVAIWRG
jgi:hypothetical protein